MQMAMPARFFQTVDMNSWFENLNDWMVIYFFYISISLALSRNIKGIMDWL